MAVFGKHRSLVGLDIGTATVKAIELTRAGRSLVITGMGYAEIEAPEAVREAVEKVLREAGIKARRCVTAVSGRSVIFRQVTMARVPDAELRQTIEWEADKYIPFDVREVQLDAQRLEEGDGEGSTQMKVLLVAVKRTLVDEHLALLGSLGLKPAVIDVDVFALGNAFELRNLSLGIVDNEVRALVDIGASKTNINILRGNQSCFPREIYVAGNDLTEAVAKRFGEDPRDVEKMKREPGGALESMQDAMLPVLEDIGSEIRLSFDYFENQYEQKVKEVYLSGGSAFFPGLDTMLTQVFNLPVKLWDPTEGLEIRNYSGATAGGSNSNMAVALGLAGRLLGTVGYAAAPAVTAPGVGAAAEAGAQVVAPAARFAAEAEEARQGWTKGFLFGTLACAAVAVAVAFLNRAGYQKPWVMLEGLPMGLAAGFGLWAGVKTLRVLPSRLPIIVSGLCIGLLCCGALFLLRVSLNKGNVKSALVSPRTGPAVQKLWKPADLPTDLPADIRNSPIFKRQAPKYLDVDEIAGTVYILTHWLLTCSVAMFIVWYGFSQIAKREAMGQLRKIAAGGGQR